MDDNVQRVTHIIANKRLLTALKNKRKIPGPSRPILVMSRRTDNTDHFFPIRPSAKCAATTNRHNIRPRVLD